MKQLKVTKGGGNNESFERSPAGMRQYLEDNSMILTGGAPIEPTLNMAETPAKKGPHYPSINYPLRNDHQHFSDNNASRWINNNQATN